VQQHIDEWCQMAFGSSGRAYHIMSSPSEPIVLPTDPAYRNHLRSEPII
jgi:hypothetical protein